MSARYLQARKNNCTSIFKQICSLPLIYHHPKDSCWLKHLSVNRPKMVDRWPNTRLNERHVLSWPCRERILRYVYVRFCPMANMHCNSGAQFRELVHSVGLDYQYFFIHFERKSPIQWSTFVDLICLYRNWNDILSKKNFAICIKFTNR